MLFFDYLNIAANAEPCERILQSQYWNKLRKTIKYSNDLKSICGPGTHRPLEF